MYKITAVRVLRLYVIEVTFADGVRKEVDLNDILSGEMFEPLKDQALFRQASVHPELETVVWPNGADLAPEYLYAWQPAQTASSG